MNNEIFPFEEDWNETNSSEYTKKYKIKKFIIPITNITRQQAEQQITQLISEYHKDVQWNEPTSQTTQMGTISINCSQNVHSKRDGQPDVSMSPGKNYYHPIVPLMEFCKKIKKI